MTTTVSRAAIPGFTSATAAIGGVRLHYWSGGDPSGPPVLLWHGFLGTAYAWREVMPGLADAGCAVFAPDMRGYGDSDKPPGEAGYDARALGGEFRALVRQIGFGGGRPITLVAHDMGAPPALLWAADYPGEVAALVYVEAPVMLPGVLSKIFSFTTEAMKEGSMWWWLLPLAPDVPERLVVGNERPFVTWFYDRHTVRRDAIEPAAVDEYLRTFAGREGVLGAMGVYRAVFKSVAQTEPLAANKVRTPVVALGGEKGLGARMPQMVSLVAENVNGRVVADCGHFVPEERPEEVVQHTLAVTGRPGL